MNYPPIVVIGLDGGSWTALDPLLAAGLMPNLARLRAAGAWGELASTLPPFTAPAWSTFMTGLNPGRHGVLSFFQQDATSYRLTEGGPLASTALLAAPAFWDRLAAAGRRTGIVNVPLTYPPRPVNGFLVSGLLTPVAADRFTYPPELAAELGPDYVVEADYLTGIMGSFDLTRLPARKRLLADQDRAETVRADACLRLLERHRPDLFLVVFASPDRISHFFWEYLDHTAPAGQPLDPQTLADVRCHFQRLDRWIGELTAAAGPDATVIVMSDHGFGPAATRWAYVNTWLVGRGLLSLHRGQVLGWTNPAFWRARLADTPLRSWLISRLPVRLRRAVRGAERPEDAVDWSATAAYATVLYANVAGVRVNLAGRQTAGIVPAGAEYEAVRDQIIAAAAVWRDPDTGRPVVTRADRREALYHGEHVADFPDVILELAAEYAVVAGTSPRTVTPAKPTFRTGEHRPAGVFVAHGPAIQQGARPAAQMADLAPTLLHLAGLPIPADLDGRVLTEALDQTWLARHPVQMADDETTASPASAADVYTPEEEAILTRHLAALGYL